MPDEEQDINAETIVTDPYESWLYNELLNGGDSFSANNSGDAILLSGTVCRLYGEIEIITTPNA